MMDSQTNTFLGGMNLDLDVTMLNDSQYRFAENIRIVTDLNGTTGILLNILSNKEIFLFEDTVLYITNVDKYVIVITGIDGSNKIYRLIIEDGEVKENVLVASSELGYTPESNIKTVFSIESAENIKMYITADEPNEMIRVINIMKDNTNADVGIFDIIPNAIIDKPEFVEYVTDTKIFKHKVVQYAIQFFNLRGSSTTVSPVSELIYSKEDSPAGIKMHFKCDPSFEYYRLYRIVYKDKQELPVIEIVDEQQVTSSELDYTDNGYNFLSEVTLDEFNIITNNNFHAATIESKNNILFAANITPNTWDIAYDARAYRATEDGMVKIVSYGTNPRSIEFNIHDGIPDIPEQYDCINPYNTEFEVVGRPLPGLNLQYKYNSYGELGGTGINLSYKFITEDTLADYIDDLYSEDSPTIPVDNVSRGYQRDEIYRFGIVFYNYKGIASPVHWIGDIRMPSFTEMPTTNAEDIPSGYRLALKQLGIEFTVWGVPQIVLSYQIVRCERTILDRTVLMQGVLSQVTTMPYKKFGGKDIFVNSIGTQVDIRPRIPLAMPDYETLIGGASNYLNDNTVENLNIGVYNITDRDGGGHNEENYAVLISADIDFNTFDYSDYLKNSYVDYLCWLNSSFEYSYGTKLALIPGICDMSYSQDKFANYDEFGGEPGSLINFNYLDDPTVCYFNSGTQSVLGKNLVIPLIFKRYKHTEMYTAPKLDIVLAITPTLLENDSYLDVSIYYTAISDKQYINIGHTVNYGVDLEKSYGNRNGHFGKCCVIYSTTPFQRNTIKPTGDDPKNPNMLDIPLVNIKRRIIPYGGDTYSTRSNSVYIGTGAVKRVFDPSEMSRGMKTFDVFGGDTQVLVHDHKTCCIPGLSSDYRQEFAATEFLSISDYIPFETTVNIQYADNINTIKTSLILTAQAIYDANVTKSGVYVDPYLNTTIKGGTIGGTHAQTKPYYGYDDVYSVDSTAVLFTPKLMFALDYQMPTRVIYSDVKINNEVTDSWQKFRVGNYLDVDTKHGGITNLHIFLDKLFFFQSRAVGILSVNERSLITDDNINLLTLGTGGILSRYDYATTDNGTDIINDSSIINSPFGMYWYDPLVKELCSFTNSVAKLSKLKLVQSYINKYCISANTAYYDNKFNEVCMTFKCIDDKNAVLVYNELVLAFTSFYTFVPDKSTSLSNYPLLVKDNLLYYNCRYEEDKLESVIKIIVNKQPANTKVFDNIQFSGNFDNILEMLTNVSFFNLNGTSTVHGGYHDGYDIDYREYTYRFAIGRNENETDVYSYPERMRGKYLECLYTLNCDNQKEFNLPSITTTFRYSNI